MRTSRIIGLWVLAVGISTQVVASTLYVDVGSSAPTAPYASWATAAVNIQDALNVAGGGDIVLVTNGIYKTGGISVPEQTGGFETNRVMLTNAVTLASVNGPGVTTIAGGMKVRCAYVGSNAVLSGFTLTGGDIQYFGSDTNAISGAGAWCEASGLVMNCIISSNQAFYGGGGAGGLFLGCAFTANAGFASGGGIYQATASNCTFVTNITDNAGGGAANSVLINCTLNSNSVVTRSYSGGGGAFRCILSNCVVQSSTCSVGTDMGIAGGTYGGTNYNCVIAGNRDRGTAGGTYLSLNYGCTIIGNIGAGVYLADTLFNSTVSSNTGAGVYHVPMLSNCIVSANLGGAVGMGTYLYNCVISNNTGLGVELELGGLMTNCSVLGNSGGGIQTVTPFARVYNSIVAANGIFGVSGAFTANSSVIANNGIGISGANAYNCVISGNLGVGAVRATLDSCSIIDNPGGGIQKGSAVNSIIYFNDRQGGSNWYTFTNGANMSYCCTFPSHPGTGNLTNDPMLFAPNLGSGIGDYRLKIGSPCIDTGHTSLLSDANGTPRPLDGDGDGVAVADIGALEFDPLAIVGTNWLITHGLDPNDPLVFSQDPDHDGMNNLQEWLAGTDPTNAASVFQIIAVSQQPAGAVSFPSTVGRVYTLLSSSQLPGGWTPVASQINVPGTGGVMQLSDPNPVLPAYYRVQVGLP